MHTASSLLYLRFWHLLLELIRLRLQLWERLAGNVADVTKAERQKAKSIVYGIIYGQQAQGLARILSIEVRAAQALIDSFLGRFPGVRASLRLTSTA